jgi:hypothetical protein
MCKTKDPATYPATRLRRMGFLQHGLTFKIYPCLKRTTRKVVTTEGRIPWDVPSSTSTACYLPYKVLIPLAFKNANPATLRIQCRELPTLQTYLTEQHSKRLQLSFNITCAFLASVEIRERSTLVRPSANLPRRLSLCNGISPFFGLVPDAFSFDRIWWRSALQQYQPVCTNASFTSWANLRTSA